MQRDRAVTGQLLGRVKWQEMQWDRKWVEQDVEENCQATESGLDELSLQGFKHKRENTEWGLEHSHG